jgi:hypothetical protein
MLTSRDLPADRHRGLELLVKVRYTWLRERIRLYLVPHADVIVAREHARGGDRDGAIRMMRTAVNDLFQSGQLWACVVAIGILVETLLDRGAASDGVEAEAGIDRLADLPATEGWVARDVWLLRMRALLARAHGVEAAYREDRDRYRDMAKTFGFEGHIDWAEAML